MFKEVQQQAHGSGVGETLLTSWRTHKILKENEEYSGFSRFPFMSKTSDSSKLIEKLEQENEEESSLGWRMKLIYLNLVTQVLKNTKN